MRALGDYSPFETFREIFNGDNVGHEAYFDKMTHFDFKTLLPALLQVEDRVSMAHGLESRVPLLDHRLIELAATIPADVKFKDGHMKHIFKRAHRKRRPRTRSLDRKDKMGFPVPLSEWLGGGAREFVTDVLSSRRRQGPRAVRQPEGPRGHGRRADASAARSGACCRLELWQRAFHDREREFHGLLTTQGRTSSMKVLITGGGGFIGSHLADRLLADGHEVARRSTTTRPAAATTWPSSEGFDDRRGLDRRRETVDEAFGSFEPDAVAHAAASYKDPDAWVEDTRDQRARHAPTSSRRRREAGVDRIVYFQTALCYGTKPIEQPITLSHPIRPDSSYAISKTAGEQYIELSAGSPSSRCAWPTSTGPRNLSGPPPTFFQRLSEGKPCFVDGHPPRLHLRRRPDRRRLRRR